MDVARIVPILAALAFVAGAFLPWVSAQGEDANSFDIPAAFLIDETATDGLDLGYLVVGVGAIAAFLAFAGPAALRRILGVAILAIVGLFGFQLGRLLEGSGLDASDVYGTALYVGLIAGVVVVGAPSSRRSP